MTEGGQSMTVAPAHLRQRLQPKNSNSQIRKYL